MYVSLPMFMNECLTWLNACELDELMIVVL